MISKSNSANSLSFLASSPSNKVQTSIKEQVIATDEDASDLKEVSSLFQSTCNTSEPSPKTMLEYADDILALLPSTQKETEMEAIKNELIKIIDSQTFHESDFADIQSDNLVVIFTSFSKKLIKEYIKYHKLYSNEIDSNKKQELKDKLTGYIGKRFIPLTNDHKQFVKEHPRLFKPISIADLYKRIL